MKSSIAIRAAAVVPVVACSAFGPEKAPACDRPGKCKRANHPAKKLPANHRDSYGSQRRPVRPEHLDTHEDWVSADLGADYSDLPVLEVLGFQPHVHWFLLATVAARASESVSTASWAQASALVPRLFVQA